MIIEELMNTLIDYVPASIYPIFYMSPAMHKRIYMLKGLSRLDNHSPRKLRKVHERKIAARRQAKCKQLAQQYSIKLESDAIVDEFLRNLTPMLRNRILSTTPSLNTHTIDNPERMT